MVWRKDLVPLISAVILNGSSVLNWTHKNMLIDFYKLMQPCRIEYVFWLCGINWCWSPLVNIESELRNSLFKELNYELIVKPPGVACHSFIVAFRFLKSSWKARSWSFTNGKEMYLNCWKMFMISSTCFQRLITKNSINCGFSIMFRCYAVLLLMYNCGLGSIGLEMTRIDV